MRIQPWIRVAAPAAFLSAAIMQQGSSTGNTLIAPVSRGIYSANQMGQVPNGAEFTQLAADGARTDGFTFQCGAPGKCPNVPINLGAFGDQVSLMLFGTGFRARSSLANVPQALAGRGQMLVQVIIDGRAANAVQVAFQ